MFYRQKINNIEIISPSEEYLKNIKTSFKRLKHWDVKSFVRVNRYLKVIIINPFADNYNHLVSKEKAWVVGHDLFGGDYDAPYLASLLVHETHHLLQYNRGIKNYGEKAEKAAYKKQRSFLKNIKYDYAVQWLDEQYKAKWWKKMDSQKLKKKKSDNLFADYKNNKLIIKELRSIKI